MKKLKLFLQLGLLSSLVVLCGLANASEITAFGPKEYIRTTGAPNIYEETFSAEPGEARIVIRNGLPGEKVKKDKRIRSGVITLNGVDLFTHSDFKHQTHILETVITLLPENDLRIELESIPTHYLSIEIIQEIPDPVYDIQATNIDADNTNCPESIDLKATIVNIGEDEIAAGLHVSFYNGLPGENGVLIGTASTSTPLLPTQTTVVSYAWVSPTGESATVYAVADDDGSGSGAYEETDETNNLVSVETFLCPVIPAGESSIAGKIIDAVTGDPLSTTQILLHLDNNGSPGAVAASTTSDLDGTFLFDGLAEGAYILTASPDGYISGEKQVSLAANTDLTNQDLALSPVLADGEVRIILTWNDRPADLEAHLTSPSAEGCRYHCYYFNKTIPDANLDLDDRDGYGPETITITDIGTGIYRYYVHDFTNRTSRSSRWLSYSGAKVKVYSGSNPPVVFDVTPAKYGTVWHVFNIDGSTGEVIPINIMDFQSEPGKIDYPTITSYPSTQAYWNTPWSYQVKATDPDLDTLTYELLKAPTGMTIDPSTGLIQWTPAGSQSGYYSVEVRVDDGRCGEATQSFSVRVYSYPTVNFSVDPCSGVNPGGEITLTWSTTRATTVYIEPGIGEVALSGSLSFPSPAEPTLYTITALNDAELSKRSVPTSPSASFYFSPRYIYPGQSTTLYWTPYCAANATIDHDIGPVTSAGSKVITPAADTIYTYYHMAVSNAYRTNNYTAWVKIIQPPPPSPPSGSITAPTADRCNLTPGDPVTLSWSTVNATTVTISPDIGEVEPSGSITVYPTEATTYTLTMTGDGGTRTSSITLPNYPSLYLTPSSRGIDLGDSVTLSWSSSCADTVVMDQGIGELPASGSITVTPESLPIRYYLRATNERGTNTRSSYIYQIAPTGSITTNPTILKVGDSTTLSWSSTRADTCFITPDFGEVPCTGTTTVTPIKPTTYRLKMVGPGGTLYRYASVNFVPPMADLKASSLSIVQGESVKLTWIYANADTAYIDQGVGNIELGGERTVAPTTTTIYRMTATGPGGTAYDTVTVNVGTSTTPPPTVSLLASQTIILRGGSTDLTWQTDGATSVTIEPDVGMVDTSGTVTVTPEKTTTYTATATGPSGTSVARVTINVQQPSPVLTFQADKTAILEGSSAVLSWTSEYADRVILEPGFGDVDLQGSVTVTPTMTSTYKLTGLGLGGTVSKLLTLVVYPLLDLQVTSPADGITVNTPSITVTGQISEGANVTVNGTPATISGNTFSAEVTFATPGAQTITVTAADNYGQEKTVVLSVTYIPELTLSIDSPADTQILYTSPVIVSGQVSNNASVTVSGVTATVSGDTFTASVPLSTEGEQSLVVEATDTYGQQISDSVNILYFTMPTVSLSADKLRIASGDSVTLTWESLNCLSATLEPNIGSVDCNGTITLPVTETTSFVIRATGATKTDRATVAVVVDDPYGNPSPEEQAHLEAINKARANPLAEAARLNIDLNEGPPEETISPDPVPPLRFNELLHRAAIGHTLDMINNDFFAHNGSDGSTPAERCAAEGYVGGTGENIAATSSSIPPTDLVKTSLDLHDALFIDYNYPGRGHRVNMLREGWKEVGVGFRPGSVDAGVPYGGAVTCNFGDPSAGGASVVGLVFDDKDQDQAYDLDEGIGGVLIKDMESGEQVYTASAGGYSLPLSPGEHTLEATLPDGRKLTKQVVMGQENIKLDFLVEMFSNPDPTVSLTGNVQAVRPGESAQLIWHSSNSDYAQLDNGLGFVPPNGSLTVTPSTTTTYTITATGNGKTAVSSFTVYVNDFTSAPTLDFFASPATINKGESTTLTWTTQNAAYAHIDNGVGPVLLNGSVLVAPEHSTTYTITVTSPAGVINQKVRVFVVGSPAAQPAGSFGSLYNDQIPADATVDAYAPERFSLITGVIEDVTGSPLSGVSVTVLDHPEYGTAITDGLGEYTIPVEGGFTLTVKYDLIDHLSAQRQVYVPVNDVGIADTVQLLQVDPLATEVVFDGNPNSVTVHKSSVIRDAHGERSISMVFQGDNRAYVVDENGDTVRTLTNFTTRATEYQTPESMPAELPKTSAFTYCSELAVDGVDRVRFAKPVVTWVDNFLGFDVGFVVPSGYYDRDKGVWVASQNGIVVELLDTNGDGITDAIDSDGDGQPNDLNNNMDIRDEALGLGNPSSYPPGATFWRVEVTHFTPWDFNMCSFQSLMRMFGYAIASLDGQSCPLPDQECTGSSVENESLVFHEDIAIPGTGLSLAYSSDRTEGFKNVITVPVSGSEVHPDVTRIIVEVDIAGQRLVKELPPTPNQVTEFIWNGLDWLGNPVPHKTTAHVRIGYAYPSYYMDSGYLEMAFAMFGSTISNVPTRDEVINWRRSDLTINVADKIPTLAQGWSISAHHVLSPTDPNTLHKGDGSTAKNITSVMKTVAGNGNNNWTFDGTDALQAPIGAPASVAMDSEGRLYVANMEYSAILRINQDNTVENIAGGPYGASEEDGIQAKDARILIPIDIAFDNRGNLYIADAGAHKIRKIDTNGIITTVAGNGLEESSGDMGPATDAGIMPTSVAVDDFGNIYFAEGSSCVGGEVDPVTGECIGGTIVDSSYRVRKVSTNGIIATIVGTGEQYDPAVHGSNGDGGHASEAYLLNPSSVSVDRDANLYIADGSRIRKVNSSGSITTVAGTGQSGYLGDGGLATEAQITHASGVVFDNQGNFYFSQFYGNGDVIRKVSSDGYITTVAGVGEPGLDGDFGPATHAQLQRPQRLVMDLNGFIIVPDKGNGLVRKVFLDSYQVGETHFVESNGLGYLISQEGYHTMTYDLETEVPLLTFSYDTNNQLNTITDQFGNVVTIETLGGIPSAIVSPDGLRTELTIDANNQLTKLTYPDTSFHSFEYTNNDGLLTAKNEPNGNRFEHFFDTKGRVTATNNTEGGLWQFARNKAYDGTTTSSIDTPNTTKSTETSISPSGTEKTVTKPSGETISTSISADGLDTTSLSTCGPKVESWKDLDRWYGYSYGQASRVTTPSGLEMVISVAKDYLDDDSDNLPDKITTQITVNGKTSTVVHDILHADKTITSPENRTVTSKYDPATLQTISSTVPGLFTTQYSYFSDGKLLSVLTGARKTSYTYNSLGNLASVTDPQNRTTYFPEHDDLGRVTKVVRPDSSVLQYNYDNNGNMTLLVTPTPADNNFTYNGISKHSSYQTPLGYTTSYAYNAERQLTKVMLPSAKEIVNTYSSGRLTQTTTSQWTTNYNYDCGDLLKSITRGAESISYSYDGTLPTSITQAGTINTTLSLQYNNDFNPISFSYAGGTEAYEYDKDGLLTRAGAFAVARNADNGLPVTVADALSSLNRVFNGYGEVESSSLTVNGTTLMASQFSRNESGKIVTKTETIDGVQSTLVYTYDAPGRLLTVTRDGSLVEEYRYDANGNRSYETNTALGIAGRSFTHSVEDHIVTAGPVSYEFDLDDNLSARIDGTETTNYAYSSTGELLSVYLPDGTAISYINDAMGRRVARVVDDVIVEKYLWSGLTTLLAVYDGNDNLIQRFEYADGRMPNAMTMAGNVYYLAYDQVGSLRLVSDAAGNVVKQVDYDSFGNVTSDTNTALAVPFGFAGGLHDRETGLVRFGYRDYMPEIGKWTAKDPTLFVGGDSNLYSYAHNDPVNIIDPYGLEGDINLGSGWSARVDKFNTSAGASHEIHVYSPKGEAGIFGPKGWINKHGHKGAPSNMPKSAFNKLNGVNVDMLRKQGVIPPKGTANIKGGRYLKGLKLGVVGYLSTGINALYYDKLSKELGVDPFTLAIWDMLGYDLEAAAKFYKKCI